MQSEGQLTTWRARFSSRHLRRKGGAENVTATGFFRLALS